MGTKGKGRGGMEDSSEGWLVSFVLRIVMSIVVMLIVLPIFVYFLEPNKINSIDMQLYIDSNGNAHVTETWKAHLTSGTEGYRSFTALGNRKITNFKVKDEVEEYQNGKSPSTINKNGIIIYTPEIGKQQANEKASWTRTLSDGIELCWNIGEYGKRTYTLEYTIENFVIQYSDQQGINFDFLDLDQKVGKVKVTIHSDIAFTKENASLAIFGFDGKAYFDWDGNIVLKPYGSFSEKEYMVALVGFKQDMFTTANQSTQSFEEAYMAAKEEAPYVGQLRKMLTFLFTIAAIGIAAKLVQLAYKKQTRRKITLDSGEEARVLYTKYNFALHKENVVPCKQAKYYREIPCEKNIFFAYWVANTFSIGTKAEARKNIVGAFLLKWLKEGNISFAYTESLYGEKKRYDAIDFKDFTKTEDEYETKLLTILRKAAGLGTVLEPEVYKTWRFQFAYYLDTWFDELLVYAQQMLEKEGHIKASISRVYKLKKTKLAVEQLAISEELTRQAVKLNGFKRYLLDFSIIDEREMPEVSLWEEYLIFAQVLGIAEGVEARMNTMYPAINNFKIVGNQVKELIGTISDTSFMPAYRFARLSYNFGQYADSFSQALSRGGSSSGGGSGSGGGSSGGSSGGGFR